MLRVVLLLALVGCDGTSEPEDAGAEADAGEAPDAGAGEDAGMAADGGPPLCACDGDEICVANVCVADCGVMAETLTSALGPAVVPVAQVCRTGAALEVGEDTLFALSSETVGTETTLTLASGPFTGGAPTTRATGAHDTGDVAVSVFAGGFVALDTGFTRAAFGYTTSAGFGGGVFVATLLGGATEEVTAPGNFDAAFLDADTLLVNGLGAAGADAGQGIYAVDLSGADPEGSVVLTNMGAYSGSVEVTADYVLAGGVDGDTFAGTVWVVSRAAFLTALTTSAPIDVTTSAAEVTDPDGLAIPTTFRLVRDRLVTLPYGGPVTSYALAWDGSALTLSDPQVLATGETFTDVLPAPDGGLALVHVGGLLLVL